MTNMSVMRPAFYVVTAKCKLGGMLNADSQLKETHAIR